MTDFTDEQLEEVERALRTYADYHSSVSECMLVAEVMAELKPKPEFAEGQVLFDNAIGEFGEYDPSYPAKDCSDCRPLTPTELGPAVMGLWEEAKFSQQGWSEEHKSKKLREALAAFDAVHGEK